MLEESIKPPATLYNSLLPQTIVSDIKIRVEGYGGCLKQCKISYNPKSVMNL